MKTCQIVMEAVPDPLRANVHHHIPVRVEGDMRAPIAISYYALRHISLDCKAFPKKIGMMGLDWRLLEERMAYADALYMCVTPWPFRWMFHKSALIVENAWRWFFMRIILTLHVWGLADVPAYEIPSWRHIGTNQIRKVKQLWQSQTELTAIRTRRLRGNLRALWRRARRRR